MTRDSIPVERNSSPGRQTAQVVIITSDVTKDKIKYRYFKIDTVKVELRRKIRKYSLNCGSNCFVEFLELCVHVASRHKGRKLVIWKVGCGNPACLSNSTLRSASVFKIQFWSERYELRTSFWHPPASGARNLGHFFETESYLAK